MTGLTPEIIWKALELVKDPEIPVVSVVELGLIRAVTLDGVQVTVVLTPTFSGCPALQTIQAEVRARCLQAGAQKVDIEVALSPAWTTEWITPAARQKLKEFGLAPPPRHRGLIDAALLEVAACPYCDSTNTRLTNSFGPTLCRAMYVCQDCRQPFEQFKPL